MSTPATHHVFVPQGTLEAWLDSGQVQMEGNALHLERLSRTYDVEPAVRFVRVVEGDGPTALLGKVLPESAIAGHGGELLGDSVVFGEVAFEVVPGFIAVARGAR